MWFLFHYVICDILVFEPIVLDNYRHLSNSQHLQTKLLMPLQIWSKISPTCTCGSWSRQSPNISSHCTASQSDDLWHCTVVFKNSLKTKIQLLESEVYLEESETKNHHKPNIFLLKYVPPSER